MQSIKFDGYASGQTAFFPELVAFAPDERRTAYQDLVTRLVNSVLDPAGGQRTAVTVAGGSSATECLQRAALLSC